MIMIDVKSLEEFKRRRDLKMIKRHRNKNDITYTCNKHSYDEAISMVRTRKIGLVCELCS